MWSIEKVDEMIDDVPLWFNHVEQMENERIARFKEVCR